MKAILIFLGIFAASSQPAFGSVFCPERLVQTAQLSVIDVLATLDGAAFEEAVQDLAEMVAIPSLSAPAQYAEELEAQQAGKEFILTPAILEARTMLDRAAEKTVQLFRDAGLDSAQIERIPGHGPIVTATSLHAPGAATLLLYAHIDVVDPGELADWTTPPFELSHRDGRYYARGTADDKGGLVSYLAAMKAFHKAGRPLPVNLKLIVESGEEVGSDLREYFQKNAERFQCDVAFMLDGGNAANSVPALASSVRGFFGFEVEYQSAPSTVHSGQFGGAIPSALKDLNRALTFLENEEGEINLPLVRRLRQQVSQTPVSGGESDEMYRTSGGLLPGVSLVGGGNSAFRVGRLPNLNYSLVQSDAAKVENRTRIPGRAWTSVSIRAVPGLDEALLETELREFFAAHNPHGMQIKLRVGATVPAWGMDPAQPVPAIALQALSAGYGVPSVITEDGGTLPLLTNLESILPRNRVVFYGISTPDSNIHGTNEFIPEATFKGAIRSTILMFAAYGQPEFRPALQAPSTP